jgi:hypothetical protein
MWGRCETPAGVVLQSVRPHRKLREFASNFSLALGEESLLLLALFHAPVAQLDRASDYGSEGLGFDSLRVRHLLSTRYVTK